MLGQLKAQQRRLDELVTEQHRRQQALKRCNTRWRGCVRNAISSRTALAAAAGAGVLLERLTATKRSDEPTHTHKPEQSQAPNATQKVLQTVMRAVLSAAVSRAIAGIQDTGTDPG